MTDNYDKLNRLHDLCNLISSALYIQRMVDNKTKDMIETMNSYHLCTEVHLKNTLDDMKKAIDEMVDNVVNLVHIELGSPL